MSSMNLNMGLMEVLLLALLCHYVMDLMIPWELVLPLGVKWFSASTILFDSAFKMPKALSGPNVLSYCFENYPKNCRQRCAGVWAIDIAEFVAS